MRRRTVAGASLAGSALGALLGIRWCLLAHSSTEYGWGVLVATYATVDDVVAEYDGTIADDQIEYVERKLTSAELVVKAVAGDIGARIGAGQTSFEAVKLVLCNMVIRLLRNPEGVRTQTVGPFSVSLDQSSSSAQLVITREDRQLLGLKARARGTVTLDDPALSHVLVRPALPRRDRWGAWGGSSWGSWGSW